MDELVWDAVDGNYKEMMEMVSLNVKELPEWIRVFKATFGPPNKIPAGANYEEAVNKALGQLPANKTYTEKKEIAQLFKDGKFDDGKVAKESLFRDIATNMKEAYDAYTSERQKEATKLQLIEKGKAKEARGGVEKLIGENKKGKAGPSKMFLEAFGQGLETPKEIKEAAINAIAGDSDKGSIIEALKKQGPGPLPEAVTEAISWPLMWRVMSSVAEAMVVAAAKLGGATIDGSIFHRATNDGMWATLGRSAAEQAGKTVAHQRKIEGQGNPRAPTGGPGKKAPLPPPPPPGGKIAGGKGPPAPPALGERCNKCARLGHRLYQCTNPWWCFRCSTSGHKASECTNSPKAKRYPPG